MSQQPQTSFAKLFAFEIVEFFWIFWHHPPLHLPSIDGYAAKRHICLRAVDTVHNEARALAKRGSNSFRRNDGIRALRVARDGGMEPSALEIVVGADGVMAVAPETAASAKEWEQEIQRLKPKARFE